MSNVSNQKGRSFEALVERMLRVLESEYPRRVRVFAQPHIALSNNQELIPDFDLRYDLPIGESRHWIELQDRKRSSPQIAQKIKYAKVLSNRNRFIFIYRSSIPSATRKSLEDDGVMCMSFKEFTAYVSALDLTLKKTASIQSIGGAVDGMMVSQGSFKVTIR